MASLFYTGMKYIIRSFFVLFAFVFFGCVGGVEYTDRIVPVDISDLEREQKTYHYY